MELAGYHIVEKLSGNEEIEVYRMFRQQDNRCVIAKTTREPYPGAAMVAAFRREYDILVSLAGRGAAEPYSLEFTAERPVLLLTDIGGSTLDQVRRSSRSSLPALLGIAAALAESLVHVHSEQITLHELSPCQVMVNPGTLEVRLIDLRLCSTPRGRSPLWTEGDRPDSVLPYVSPEQTGRTDHVIDYRTDFYSLGITLYEWLTGALPFASADTLDIVYRHLAGKPMTVNERAPAVPRMVSEVIRKCMEKMPEDRYFSAFGIRADLEHCLFRFRESRDIGEFELAGRDTPDRWVFPEQLYGRKDEEFALLGALERTLSGGREVVVVKGSAGSGKTTYVRTTLRDAAPGAAIALNGRSDAHTSVPYAVWEQMLGELTEYVLTESASMLDIWRQKIEQAADGCGALLFDLAPRLKLVIGEQPPVAALPPLEAQQRMRAVLTRVLLLFARKQHPLVLVLDDLQWADEASLQLLEHLLTERAAQHVLIVCMLRSEAGRAPLLLARLERSVGASSSPLALVELGPLDAADVKLLLDDALQATADDTAALADVVVRKTAGNPFFVKQFMQQIVERKLLRFDDRRRNWLWDLDGIHDMDIPDNAADYMLVRMNELPPGTLHTLGCAACLGVRFEPAKLAGVIGCDESDLLEAIGIAVHSGLLRESGGGYQFQHDRIRQAAYMLVPEEERLGMHRIIGWMLVAELHGGQSVFEAVNHLNTALGLEQSAEGRQELAALNLRAGLTAKQAAAYETARGYFRQASLLLEADCWRSRYELTFRIYRELAEAEFLCARYDEARRLLHILLERSVTALDKASAYAIMLLIQLNRGDSGQIVLLARESLGLLGVSLDRHTLPTLAWKWLKLRIRLNKRTSASLYELPEMTDERYRLAMFIIHIVGNASFIKDTRMWMSCTLAMMELTLTYGKSPESPLAYVGFGIMIHYLERDHKTVYEWGKLALESSRPSPAIHAAVKTSFCLCYESWYEVDKSVLDLLTDKSNKFASQYGDLWHDNQGMLVTSALLVQYARPLGETYERLVEQSSNLLRGGNALQVRATAILTVMIAHLTGVHSQHDVFAHYELSDPKLLEPVEGDVLCSAEMLACYSRYMTHVLFGRYSQAYPYIVRSAVLVRKYSSPLLEDSTHCMFSGLVSAGLYEQADEREKKEHMANLRASIRQLKKLAARSPVNYRHKYLLLKAEYARLRLREDEAESFYMQTIEDAREQALYHNLGIAAERLAVYGLQRGKLSLARLYMLEAYEAYMQWGALTKAADLQDKYGHLLRLKQEPDRQGIDYLSVMMSAQALSGEMEMPRLLDKLMRIMLRNAGAEYGALIFDYGDKWVVEAYGTDERITVEPVRLDEAQQLVPLPIVGYAAKTREEVVLHDAAAEGLFARHPDVRDRGLRSVLCLPVINQSKLLCLLYMENKLSAGLFTPERLDVLKLLCSQCAISIDNAQMYSDIRYLKDNLEQQVKRRTHSLELSMRETASALSEMAVYEERNRIAQDIHDVVGHTLTSTILQIEAGRRLIHKNKDGAVSRLEEARDLIKHGLNEIRRSVHMLKEGQAFELSRALRKLIMDTERNAGVRITADIEELPELSTAHKKVIYHALQEGLTNGIRHGHSTAFTFMLGLRESALQFVLTDNGEGAAGIEMGFGLRAMKERVEQLGGRLRIQTSARQGCELSIELPYPLQLERGAVR